MLVCRTGFEGQGILQFGEGRDATGFALNCFASVSKSCNFELTRQPCQERFRRWRALLSCPENSDALPGPLAGRGVCRADPTHIDFNRTPICAPSRRGSAASQCLRCSSFA
jgi:hypothetical protein